MNPNFACRIGSIIADPRPHDPTLNALLPCDNVRVFRRRSARVVYRPAGGIGLVLILAGQLLIGLILIIVGALMFIVSGRMRRDQERIQREALEERRHQELLQAARGKGIEKLDKR